MLKTMCAFGGTENYHKGGKLMRWYKIGNDEVQARSPADAQEIIKQRKEWEKRCPKKKQEKHLKIE